MGSLYFTSENKINESMMWAKWIIEAVNSERPAYLPSFKIGAPAPATFVRPYLLIRGRTTAISRDLMAALHFQMPLLSCKFCYLLQGSQVLPRESKRTFHLE